MNISAYIKTTELLLKLKHEGILKEEDITEDFILEIKSKLEKGIDVEKEIRKEKKKKRFFFF